jgi:hypothetical protein
LCGNCGGGGLPKIQRLLTELASQEKINAEKVFELGFSARQPSSLVHFAEHNSQNVLKVS